MKANILPTFYYDIPLTIQNMLFQFLFSPNGKFVNHLIPNIHDTFDIGSPEYKIRDLYVSDTSIWIGDRSKIEFSGGKMKLKRLKNNDADFIPTRLRDTNVSLKTGINVRANKTRSIITKDDIQSITTRKGGASGTASAENLTLIEWVDLARDTANLDVEKPGDFFHDDDFEDVDEIDRLITKEELSTAGASSTTSENNKLASAKAIVDLINQKTDTTTDSSFPPEDL